MEDRENTILAGLLAFVLVMAFIGWAKFVDMKQDAELWYARYSDEVDELREVKATLDDTEFMRQACIVDRDFYKDTSFANELAGCEFDLRGERIGAEAELRLCHSQLADILNKFYSPEPCRPYHHTVQCGWDMCACNDGFEGCPIYVLEYYTDQAVCRTNTNCKNCMWQMVDNGGGLEHDEILWCLEHAYLR